MNRFKNNKPKNSITERPALYTDYYELTMAQGYFLCGREKEQACFDYFFRKLPFEGGYVIFAGLSDLIEALSNFKFHSDELEYLKKQGFRKDFLQFLKNLELSVSIRTAKEGEIVFPNEPILRLQGSIIEAQLLETIILNILNFESLIATKASRMKYAAGNRKVLDFGLRRAQGFGGIQASKAAIIGGLEATSNTYASFVHNIPASGTMAHSWIQSFDDELTAFRKYAEHYPDNCILLVDTYDTLSSGVPNAIKVAKELERNGHQLKGVRLDSGDLAYFARKTRKQLDRAGLEYVKIAVSNQLDERIIQSLIGQQAPIDLFGVGTRLVTGNETPALDGVYKLSAVDDNPKLKISENVEKVTLPGIKKVLRLQDSQGFFYGDAVVLDSETDTKKMYHPHYPAKQFSLEGFRLEPLLHPVIDKGNIVAEVKHPQESASYSQKRLKKLNREHQRFEYPHIYKVGISEKLMNLRNELSSTLKKRNSV